MSKFENILKKHYTKQSIDNLNEALKAGDNPLLFVASKKDRWICEKLNVVVYSGKQLNKLKQTKEYQELSAKYDTLEAFL